MMVNQYTLASSVRPFEVTLHENSLESGMHVDVPEIENTHVLRVLATEIEWAKDTFTRSICCCRPRGDFAALMALWIHCKMIGASQLWRQAMLFGIQVTHTTFIHIPDVPPQFFSQSFCSSVKCH